MVQSAGTAEPLASLTLSPGTMTPGVDLLPLAVAKDCSGGLQRLPQGRHRIAGLGRLVPSDGRVTELDGKQNPASG
jgi:hypothetical protein